MRRILERGSNVDNSRLLVNESPLVLLPSLAVAFGLNEAIVLQQLQYWLSNSKAGIEHEGRKWIHNTLEEWREQLPFWSVDTIKRTLKNLRDKGLIECATLSENKWDKTLYYTLNYALIEEGTSPLSNRASCTNRGVQDAHIFNVTETSSETSSENNNIAQSAGDAEESKTEKPKRESTAEKRQRERELNYFLAMEQQKRRDLLTAIQDQEGHGPVGIPASDAQVKRCIKDLDALLAAGVTPSEIQDLAQALRSWGPSYKVTPHSLNANLPNLRAAVRSAKPLAPPTSAAPPADAPRRGRDFAKERFVMDPAVEFAVAPRKGLEAEIMGEDWAYERGGAGSLKYLALICQMGDPEAQEVFEYPPLNPAYVPHPEDGQFDYILTAAQESYKRRGLDSTGRVALRVAA